MYNRAEELLIIPDFHKYQKRCVIFHIDINAPLEPSVAFFSYVNIQNSTRDIQESPLNRESSKSDVSNGFLI